ncbi:DUF3102 domain-containing protein [Paenibacillus phoenicis]|uniref:DUF3102 domain-containing protein n=1 Tax=Paenibacillus phoenicis TaxID=554117 RepID=UPI003D2DDAEA
MTTAKKTKKTESVQVPSVVAPGEKAISNRTPEVIAAEIRSIDQQARKYVLQSAIEIGEKLIEAKELVAHGEWGAWLKDNVNYSQSTANNFMNVAREYKNTNSQALANLSYTQAVALLSVPAGERETFAEENNVAEMSSRELQAAIKEKQELERLLAEERERVKQEQLAREEEKEQREALYAQYRSELELRQKMQEDLAAAQAAVLEAEKGTGKPDAKTKTELRKAEKALSESQQRIAALEVEMKAKEDELNAKVEKAVKAREKELADQARKREEEAAKQVAALEEELRKNNNKAAIAVKFHFDSLVSTFKELAAALATIENEEQKKAISGRIAALCDEMKAKL